MNLNKLNDFALEVHQNAVDHGFWDEDREISETLALIHSEWSEALEEYRANRPMVWYECKEVEHSTPEMCTPKDEYDCLSYGKLIEGEICPHRGKKPEGIAVELIDGCIRILDFAGKYGANLVYKPIDTAQRSLPVLVSDFHYSTSAVHNSLIRDDASGGVKWVLGDNEWTKWLGCIVYEAFEWIASQGIDPYGLMLLKHEFNKSRPYKHGKKC